MKQILDSLHICDYWYLDSVILKIIKTLVIVPAFEESDEKIVLGAVFFLQTNFNLVTSLS